jgi:hypothetical protein
MKLIGLLAIFYLAAIGYGQEIPNGVRYKKTTDEINNLAKSGLEAALTTSSELPGDGFFGGVMVVGPTLWKAAKPRADQHLLNTKPVIIVVSGKSPITTEGRAIRTKDEKKSFWIRLKSDYPGLKNATVRKAKKDEILYFWATIPFDIDEPFLVIEAGSVRFIANFQIKEGKPELFWIDVVDDLEKLRQ